ncbi:NUDIX hydrolase [Oculatella sp. LEGE 06141]|uniref:NUDIX domain-containing protein n=1 Tax=Oculatella sp. LEGE 06141 TaxID=1828648 RepID=UPI00187F41F2|nr:NUDIX hydrolase [Oculatella sp. LEGE 06141]MBE9179874.1 NUDIX hydrolase [Oculatella sp. LEGE 06141]
MRQLWRFLQAAIKIIFRHPITGTSIIPVLSDGQIVLIQRRDNGCWSLPGGIIDWGEDISSSARRELLEETGLTLINIRRLVGVYSSPDRDPRFHSICIVLEAEVDGTMQVVDQLEVMDVRAFPPESIPLNQLSHDHGQQLRDYFAGLTKLA